MVYVPRYGIVLNNEMDDFSAQPGAPNSFGLVGNEQNAVAAGKRPLSSMSPTLVMGPNGAPKMAVGASGGPTIITGVLGAILSIIDFGQSPTEAITGRRLHHQWMPEMLFIERLSDQERAALSALGHKFMERPAFNSVQMVAASPAGGLDGCLRSHVRMGGPLPTIALNHLRKHHSRGQG